VVLCHRRTLHLRRVIEHLIRVRGIESCNIHFIAHSPSREVLEIIRESSLPNDVLHCIDYEFPSAKAAINNSTRVGCQHAFSDPSVDFCLVLEDDILLSEDSLEFAAQILLTHSDKNLFRGINFYSVENREGLSCSSYVKLNYSLGWGWLITRKIFNKLDFWTGKEDAHWDYLIEPYIRTGYIVAPFYSRVENIGFDITATHTSNDSWIRKAMSNSYKLASKGDNKFPEETLEKYRNIRWDCVVISSLTRSEKLKLFLLRRMSYVVYRAALHGSDKAHFVWREMRNKIDQHFTSQSK
jgi:hypothetical protein